MPIYELECEKCGDKKNLFVVDVDAFFDWLSTNDTCLVCGGKVRKAISPPALQFKGDGFQTPRAEDPGEDDSWLDSTNS